MMAKKMFNAQMKLKINERGATAFWIMFIIHTAEKKNEKEALFFYCQFTRSI